VRNLWNVLATMVAGTRYSAAYTYPRLRGIPEPAVILAWDRTMPRGTSSYGPGRPRR
jgi:hypothetical protein